MNHILITFEIEKKPRYRCTHTANKTSTIRDETYKHYTKNHIQNAFNDLIASVKLNDDILWSGYFKITYSLRSVYRLLMLTNY